MEGILEELCNVVSLEVRDKTIDALKELYGIWKHSYKPETIAKYAKRLTTHVADLYNDILEEAESTRNVHISELEALMQQISEVCKLLSEPLPTESFQDLPLHDANQVLKEKLIYYNQMLDERNLEINSLLEKEEVLCDELGQMCKGVSACPLPSSKELESFRIYLSNMEHEVCQRQEELQQIREDMARIFDELETKPSLDSEALIISGSKIKVTNTNMKQVKSIHSQYQEKLEVSKVTVLELREKLSQLWERLEEEPIIRNEFLRKHQGHGDKTAMAIRREISKYEERKRNNIRVFIEKMRNEILCLWEKCMVSKQERSSFHAFQSDYYTEDLLTLHEILVEELEQYYQSNEKVFELLRQRSELWEKLSELETKANDPNRYNNRGGKLLQEEKERKKISAKLPKVEEELLHLAQEYTKSTNKVFTVYGETIQSIIDNKHMEHKIDKQCQLSARKQARAVTPINIQASSTRTKLFSNTKSSANLFGTPSSTTKRKRSPIYTPKTPRLKLQENFDPVRLITPTAKVVKKSVLSIKKSGSVIKRRSGPRRSNTKIQKTLAKASTVAVLNASKSYANFKTHLVQNAHLRSSIAPSRKGTTAVLASKPVITISAPTPPRVTRQNTFAGSAQYKTPRLTRSSSVMSPGSMSGRLTTKNLPIII